MQKLKMIVTSVIVLAIVGSAFTFKAKKGAFCIAASGTQCTTYVQGQKIVATGGTAFKYFPAWTGDFSECVTTPASNSNCTATFELVGD